MTVPKNEPTPKTLSLAIGVLRGRLLVESTTEPAVVAAFTTLDKIYAAYLDGRLDWCDEKVRVRQPQPPISGQPGYGGYSGQAQTTAKEAIRDLENRDLENLAARYGDDPDVRT